MNTAGVAGMVALPTLAVRTALRLDAKLAGEPVASRSLRGRFGRLLFRVASFRLDPAARTTALEGPEPTALALGQAARDLHAALAPSVRATSPVTSPNSSRRWSRRRCAPVCATPIRSPPKSSGTPSQRSRA